MKFRLWPIVGTAAVAAIWLISAVANWHAGLALAGDPTVSHILGAASVACDVLKAVALFIVFGAIVHKRWGTALVAVVLFTLCTGWSLRSAAYFASDAITSKQAIVAHAAQLELARLQLTDTKQRRATFLAEQRVEVQAENKTARREAIAENRRGADEFSALVGDIERDITGLESAAPVMARDPLAATTGLDDKTVALVTALMFALLLELVSSSGFWLIARARYAPATKHALPAVMPMQEPQALPPAAPIAELEALGADEPDDPAAEADNVVQLDAKRDSARLVLALGQILEPGEAGDRLLMQTIAARVNPLLPVAKRITTRRQVGDILGPTVGIAFPRFQRKRLGGQTWAYGLRLRAGRESETKAVAVK